MKKNKIDEKESPSRPLIADRSKSKFARVQTEARQGEVSAQYQMGNYYKNGYGVPQNNTEAHKWYTLAAAQGHSLACYSLGEQFATGCGVDQSDDSAFFWYRLATNKGYLPAYIKLANCYLKGKGVPINAKKAVKYYKLLADRGNHAEAEYNLGVCHAEGKGVPINAKKTVKYYKLLADRGNYAEAEYNLGVCHAEGKGVPINAEEAVRYYKLSANRGYAKAQYNLGVCYAEGKGVQIDAKEAARYYKLAAEQGHKLALNKYIPGEVDEVQNALKTNTFWKIKLFGNLAKYVFIDEDIDAFYCFVKLLKLTRNSISWYSSSSGPFIMLLEDSGFITRPLGLNSSFFSEARNAAAVEILLNFEAKLTGNLQGETELAYLYAFYGTAHHLLHNKRDLKDNIRGLLIHNPKLYNVSLAGGAKKSFYNKIFEEDVQKNLSKKDYLEPLLSSLETFSSGIPKSSFLSYTCRTMIIQIESILKSECQLLTIASIQESLLATIKDIAREEEYLNPKTDELFDILKNFFKGNDAIIQQIDLCSKKEKPYSSLPLKWLKEEIVIFNSLFIQLSLPSDFPFLVSNIIFQYYSEPDIESEDPIEEAKIQKELKMIKRHLVSEYFLKPLVDLAELGDFVEKTFINITLLFFRTLLKHNVSLPFILLKAALIVHINDLKDQGFQQAKNQDFYNYLHKILHFIFGVKTDVISEIFKNDETSEEKTLSVSPKRTNKEPSADVNLVDELNGVLKKHSILAKDFTEIKKMSPEHTREALIDRGKNFWYFFATNLYRGSCSPIYEKQCDEDLQNLFTKF